MATAHSAPLGRRLLRWTAPVTRAWLHEPPSRPLPRPPQAAGPAPDYYEAGGAVPAALAREPIAAGASVQAERILLPPRLRDGLERVPLATDAIEIVLHRPRAAGPGPAPLVLMSPILGNSDLLVGGFARALAALGCWAAIVQRKELAFHPTASLARAEEEVRVLVMRSRQALDWLLTHEDLDPARLGTFGISAGAIVSSMLAGADARLRHHVWMLAGGPLGDVMVDTCEERFRAYSREVLSRTSWTRSAVRHQLRRGLRTDPLRLAHGVRPADVLLVLARFDRSVPYRYGLALWRALGRPERIVTPLGHYSTFLMLPWLRERVLQHFAQRLRL